MEDLSSKKEAPPPLPPLGATASDDAGNSAHLASTSNTDEPSTNNSASSSVLKTQFLQTPSQHAVKPFPGPGSALQHLAHFALTPGATFPFGQTGLTPGTGTSYGILRQSKYGAAPSVNDSNDVVTAGLGGDEIEKHHHQQQFPQQQLQQRSTPNLFQPVMQYLPQSEMKSAAELASRNKAFFSIEDSPQANTTTFVKKVTTDDDDGKHSAALTEPQIVLNEFPFVYDGYAGWVCRHCSHLAHYLRGPNYVWPNNQPPPNEFVDSHICFCPGLNPSIAANIEAVLQRSAKKIKIGQDDNMVTSHNPNRKQDPPTGRSPKRSKYTSTNEQDGLTMLPNTATKDQPMWTNQWSTYQQTPSQYQMMSEMSPQEEVSPFGYWRQPMNLQQQSLQQLSWQPKSSQKKQEMPSDKKSQTTKVRRPYKHKSPAGIPSNDEKYNEALLLLRLRADEIPKAAQSTSDIGTSLVEADDAELLTDYFYYMMMQLVVTRFSDKDRKTRGGKRDNVAMGYGGLQCIHCSTNDYSRKFYWSTVDRLANSFAEIPAHILKCKSCPQEVRNALLVLKDRHSLQMSNRPRGSQKVFFRRVWRRLHSGDIDAAEKASSSSSTIVMSPKPQLQTPVDVQIALKSPKRASGTAAQMLKVKAAVAAPAEKEERIVLALPQDKDWLSDMDCFVRNNVEIFSASENDLALARSDKKYPIKLGQVGLRCIHCAASSQGARLEAVMYPYSVSSIYESVRDFQRLHLEMCPCLPTDSKSAMGKLTTGCSSLSSVLRRYYVQAARALGLFDSEDGGIRAGGTVVPMISSGFSTSEMSRKRSSAPEIPSLDQAASKRQKIDRTEEV
jgi:hypothetical protein